MTRTEYLQDLANTLRTEQQWEFSIEFKGRVGWWAQPDSARWFGDEGEYLGQTWKQAEKSLRSILG